MREIEPDPELADLLKRFEKIGGVLDFVFLETEIEGPAEVIHRRAAIAAMAAIDRRLEKKKLKFRLQWDEAKLAGHEVSFASFWGMQVIAPRSSADRLIEYIPQVDGYKTAFLFPPHGLGIPDQESDQLFAEVNRLILGGTPEANEYYSWSTNWSNYFDAGNEWWGAFFWTISTPGSNRIAVIGASTTD